MATNLVVGCGYLGSRVARIWLRAGHTTLGLTRRRARIGHLRRHGLEPLCGDWNDPQSLPRLPPLDHVLISVGWDRTGGRTIEQVYVDGLRNFLRTLPSSVRRIVYISSTGVYGQSDGQTVDEQTPPCPTRRGGRACWAAEQVLATSTFAARTVVLRLAGIYGPGRLPRLRDLQAGRPLPSDPDSLLNLIHVDDAAQAVVAATSCTFAELPTTVLVSDGAPVLRRDFYNELARLYRLPAPTFATPPGHRGTAGRGRGSKRVSNRRLLDELGVVLAYPSYRSGLAAITAPP